MKFLDKIKFNFDAFIISYFVLSWPSNIKKLYFHTLELNLLNYQKIKIHYNLNIIFFCFLDYSFFKLKT